MTNPQLTVACQKVHCGVMLLPFGFRECFLDFAQFFPRGEEVSCKTGKETLASMVLSLLLLMGIRSNLTGVHRV